MMKEEERKIYISLSFFLNVVNFFFAMLEEKNSKDENEKTQSDFFGAFWGEEVVFFFPCLVGF